MKHFLRVIVSALALGLALTAAQVNLGWEIGAFLRGYWIGAGTILLAAVFLNLRYRMGYREKLRRAADLLEQGKTDEYITTVEGLLKTAQGEQLKNQLRLDLTAGYYAKKDFPNAIRLLEELEDVQLAAPLRMIQRLNLCLCYFYTNRDRQAMAVYEASDELFAPYRGEKTYGKSLAVADMLADLQKGEYDDAKELLDTARKTWTDPGITADFDYIEKLLKEKTNG